MATADRLVRDAAAGRRRPDRPAREVQRARRARGLRRRRRDARRPDDHLGARRRARAGRRPRGRLDRREARGPRQARQHVGARRPRRRGQGASTARSTCSTWSSAGSSTASRRPRSPATRSSRREAADGIPLGLTVCYDLRFPELFRILAIRGARVVTLPAAFTKVTGQAHWEILDPRARDREPGVRRRRRPDRHPPAGQGELRRLDDRRPVGRGARARARRGVLHRRQPRLRAPGRGARQAAEPRQPGRGRLPLAEERAC